MPRERLNLLVALIASTATLSCYVAPPALEPTSELLGPVPTKRVPRGDLAGAIVDAIDYRGVRSARIVARVPAPAGEIDSAVALSDLTGRFILHLPAAAESAQVDVAVDAAGWIADSFSHLSLGGELGHAAVFALHQRRPPRPPPPPPAPVTETERPRTVVRTSLPAASVSVAHGTLSGAVVDDTSGRGIASATVVLTRTTWAQILDANGEFQVKQIQNPLGWASTDAHGHFQVKGVDAGFLAVSVDRPGYVSVRLWFVPATTGGYATTIALHGVPPARCSPFDDRIPVVEVRVIDALTGRGPAAGATLVVSRAGRTEAMHGDPVGPDSLVLLRASSAGSADETSDLMVQSTGYQTWRARDVPAQLDPCARRRAMALTAWLLPAEPTNY